MNRIILTIAAFLFAGQVWAVQPDEILADPVLEARAREISKDLRCLVCQNESIDDSNASLARDLRLLVRERLVEGDSNDEVKEFIVERYGEFALLKPKSTGANAVLWWSGPIVMFFAILFGGLYVRRRSKSVENPVAALTADEQQRLDDILGRD
jgi:cytochrome c-type biogenesis protein CcmH